MLFKNIIGPIIPLKFEILVNDLYVITSFGRYPTLTLVLNFGFILIEFISFFSPLIKILILSFNICLLLYSTTTKYDF